MVTVDGLVTLACACKYLGDMSVMPEKKYQDAISLTAKQYLTIKQFNSCLSSSIVIAEDVSKVNEEYGLTLVQIEPILPTTNQPSDPGIHCIYSC